ncbi:MAG: PAS domain S-box protein [Euryarchaeota archaeon]|nr:PAS domain S-box protein [Euryarchaeota archaeon]
MIEEKFKLLAEVVEKLEEAVCVVNRDFEVVIFNRRFAELAGAEGEVLEGRSILELLPLERGSYERVLSSGEEERRLERLSRGGSRLILDVSLQPLNYGGEGYVLTVLRDVTDREELQRLKNFSDALFDSISTGIVVMDREMRVRAINTFQLEHLRRFERVRITREEAVGRPFGEISTLLDEEHQGRSFRELLGQVLDGGDVIRIYNHEHRSKSGDVVYLNITLQPLRGADGEIEGVVLLSEDVTERAMLEKEIEESRDFYENILESLGYGVAVVDREFRILMCNRAYAEMCGSGKEEIIGKRCYEVAHLKDWPCPEEKEACPVLEVFSTGSPAKVVHEHWTRGGRKFHAEITAYPLRDSTGEINLVLEVISDITERYELEKKLRETGDFLNNIVKSSGDAIIATDLEGKITFWSQGAEDMFGFTAEEVMGKSIYDLYPEDFRDKRRRMEEFLLEYPEDAIRNYRMKIYRKDGRLIDISLSLSLLKDAKGEPIGMVGISKDITREVKAEEELKRKMRELEDFYNMAIGREMKMIELKNEIEKLREELRRLRGGV